MSRPDRPKPLSVDRQEIPDTLRNRDQWVCWRYKWDNGRDEWTKVPVEAGEGGFAKSNDPDTWSTFATAISYHDNGDVDTDGIGFVVHEEDTFFGVDLDDCRDPETGDVKPWAAELLGDLDTYAEVSPSGTGLRAFGVGFLPEGRRKTGAPDGVGDVELYDNGRYLTVTGHVLSGSKEDVEQRNNKIDEIHEEYLAEDTEVDESDESGGDTAQQDTADLDDDELIEKAKNAENGDSFADLWKGSTTDYNSQSEADLALCSHLAFWTGGDRSQIDDLFRESDLYRDKWDEKHKANGDTYGEMTISKALEGRNDFYDPSKADDQQDTPNPSIDEDTDTPSDRQPRLNGNELLAVLGVDSEETDIQDLTDRQKAAGIWYIVRRRSDIHIRYREDNGTFWNFDDGIWREDGEQELSYAARQVVNPVNYGQNLLTELKEQVKATPECVLNARDFGVEPGCLAVENGLLDLDAAAGDAGGDAIRPLEPEDYAQAQVPVSYDPDATADEWDALVEEWAEDGKAEALQEYVGYCLHAGEKPIHRTLLLVGSGANGKSTFLHVVRHLLGDSQDPARNNVVSTELQTLANEKDALADLEGKLANIDDDLSSRSLGAGLGMFKKIAAGDPVRARRLYEDGFRFTPGAKQLYACNQVPDVNVAEDDDAFWRRWLLVEFPNWYPPNSRDPDLKDRLVDDETPSGVLNWAIEGRARLLENGQFTGEEEYAHAKYERWTSWGDTADQFISELERDEDGDRVSTSELYDRFKAWCAATGTDTDVGQQGLTNRAKQENFGYGKHRIDGTVQRGFKHIGFSDEVPRPEPGEADDDAEGRQDSLV